MNLAHGLQYNQLKIIRSKFTGFPVLKCENISMDFKGNFLSQESVCKMEIESRTGFAQRSNEIRKVVEDASRMSLDRHVSQFRPVGWVGGRGSSAPPVWKLRGPPGRQKQAKTQWN